VLRLAKLLSENTNCDTAKRKLKSPNVITTVVVAVKYYRLAERCIMNRTETRWPRLGTSCVSFISCRLPSPLQFTTISYCPTSWSETNSDNIWKRLCSLRTSVYSTLEVLCLCAIQIYVDVDIDKGLNTVCWCNCFCASINSVCSRTQFV